MPFADDGVIYPTTPGKVDDDTAVSVLQECLDRVSKWATERHITFNMKPGKTTAVLFHRTRQSPPDCDLKLCGQPVPVRPTYRYLGVELDRALDWKRQEEASLAKLSTAINIILRITRQNAPIFPATIFHIVKAAAVPCLMYAAHLWDPTQKWYARAHTMITKPLRAALGLHYSAHHLSILSECGLPTIQVLRSAQATRYHGRIIELAGSTPAAVLFNETYRDPALDVASEAGDDDGRDTCVSRTHPRGSSLPGLPRR